MAIKPEEYKKRLEKLRALKEAHNGEWLTVGVVNEYREKPMPYIKRKDRM